MSSPTADGNRPVPPRRLWRNACDTGDVDFRPNDDHAAIIEGVDRVCSDFDDEYWTTCDTEHTFPWEFYEAMAAGGWVGICIPEEFGGGGCGITEGALVLNRVAASGAGMNGSTPFTSPCSGSTLS